MTTPSILTRLKSKWQRIVRNRRSMAELAACPPSELHRVGQDVGLVDMDLRSLTCTHPGPSELMPRRLEQLGLDPEICETCLDGNIPRHGKSVRQLQGLAQMRA